jgi:hypothetical protein
VATSGRIRLDAEPANHLAHDGSNRGARHRRGR